MSAKKQAPAPPLKPANGFFLWRKDNYDKLKEELTEKQPNMKGLTLNKKIGKMWQNLEDKKKDKYIKQAQKLQEEYDDAMDDYIKKYGERTLKKYQERSKSKSEKGRKKSKSKSKSVKK